jgi:non-ribosomal peptide synthetase component E (peptide arylation enzyme)
MRPIYQPIDGVAYPSDAQSKAYFASRSWIDCTAGDLVRRAARQDGDKTAVACDGRQLSFRELDERTEKTAAGLLRIGLRPRDRALVQLGTTIETVEALIACFKAGIVPVCSVPQYRGIEMGQLAELSQAVAHFVQADFSAFDLVGFARQLAEKHPTLQHRIVVRGGSSAQGVVFEEIGRGISLAEAREQLAAVRIGSEDVLEFQLSGGTTGIPKIIPRFHAEYIGYARAVARVYGYASSGSSIWNLPMVHNAAHLNVLLPGLLFGRALHLQPKVDIPAFCECIERNRITHAVSIGPVAPQLLAYPDLTRHDLSSLGIFVTMNRADALEAALGVPATNLYGITEGVILGASASAPREARHGTNGTSGCPEDEMRILEIGSEKELPLGEAGELCFRGPSSLRGYFGNDAATREALTSDGFFRSADMMTAQRIDGVTYYRLEGRLRDNINRGGEKIGCEEVELFVSRFPAIADAKLVPMPDEFYGEKACAFVVLRPGHEPPAVGQLAEFLVGQGLAKFKCPERIEVVKEFPVTGVGKVDKLAMKTWLTQRRVSSK